MKRLRVRCLGGFEVWHGESQVTGFESQKTKALLAYLLAHRRRGLSRDHLAALLWPEKSDDAARRNLRQAVYSVKRALPEQGFSSLVSSDGQLQLSPELDCWYDVDAFDSELTRAYSGGLPDPHGLATAVDFYRGDFLAGFLIKDSESFDLWLTSEQERLRDKVLEALRILVESYLTRGEYRYGVQYARRLIAVDSLAEEAYRYLMQLYALSGRRSQALAQYEELRQLLETKMGVEPMPETEALYKAILRKDAPNTSIPGRDDDPIGPLIPLVGRQQAYDRLKEDWNSVLAGENRLTLVTGEAGIGKSRLVKSFLDSVSIGGQVTVLKGRCSVQGPTPYQPFPQVLRNALAADSPRAERALREAPVELLVDLVPLIPGLAHLRSDVAARLAPSDRKDVYALTPPPRMIGRDCLYQNVARIFELLAGGEETGGGETGGEETGGGEAGGKEAGARKDELDSGVLIIFLDDLHLTGPETLDLLEFLRQKVTGCRVWFLAAYHNDFTYKDSLRELDTRASAEGSDSLRRVLLERLDPDAIEKIAGALTRGDHAVELGRFLIRWGEGLPMAIAETINFLWDEGILVPGKAGLWSLIQSPEGVQLPASGSFLDLIARRFHRLPSSARRLAALAAVMGQKFDTELLQRTADELITVVEIGLELMLERWLIRRFTDTWISSGRERDLVLWARGARRGSFEFAHELVWRAIYEELDPQRRKIMHGEVASLLENVYINVTAEGDMHDPEGLCEILAHHFTQAGVWEQALFYLRQAARRARHLEARDTALDFDARSLEALDHLLATARDPQQTRRWKDERQRLEAAREQLAQRSDAYPIYRVLERKPLSPSTGIRPGERGSSMGLPSSK